MNARFSAHSTRRLRLVDPRLDATDELTDKRGFKDVLLTRGRVASARHLPERGGTQDSRGAAVSEPPLLSLTTGRRRSRR